MNLEPIKARLAAATPGPWETDEEKCCVYSVDSGAVIAERLGSETSSCVDADLIAHAPTDIAELVAEVERLREVIEGGSTTKPTHRGMVTGCTNPGHLHLADAQAALMKASRCTFETKEGE